MDNGKILFNTFLDFFHTLDNNIRIDGKNKIRRFDTSYIKIQGSNLHETKNK